LNSNGVEFIVVGAHALAWHGLPRYTKDIDFFIHPSPANAEALLRALDAFGFGSLGLTADDFVQPNQVIQLGREPNRVDLLTGLTGVGWDQCWSSRVAGEIDGVPLYFLGRDTYIKNKLASGRPQDLADAARLKEITGSEET
jgi:hypothetical protein